MSDITSFVLRKLGFVPIDASETCLPVEDLSTSVQLGSSGQARIPVEKVMGTRRFQRDLEILEHVADAHRRGERGV